MITLVGCKTYFVNVSGDEQLRFLQDEDKLAVNFDFDNMRVDEFDNEKAFIEHHTKKIDDPSKRDEWRNKWHSYRDSFQHAFVRFANERVLKDETNLRLTQNQRKADYVIEADVQKLAQTQSTK